MILILLMIRMIIMILIMITNLMISVGALPDRAMASSSDGFRLRYYYDF